MRISLRNKWMDMPELPCGRTGRKKNGAPFPKRRNFGERGIPRLVPRGEASSRPLRAGRGTPAGDSFARCVFGERGIRTPVPLARDPVFKTGAIGHSAISPSAFARNCSALAAALPSGEIRFHHRGHREARRNSREPSHAKAPRREGKAESQPRMNTDGHGFRAKPTRFSLRSLGWKRDLNIQYPMTTIQCSSEERSSHG